MTKFTDQAAMNFLVEQTTHIESEVNETVYPDITYDQLIPVDTSAHPFVQTVEYTTMEKAGQAEWINGNADDIPHADVSRGRVKKSVYMAAIGYEYGYEELEQAFMLGVPLTADKADAARYSYETFVQKVAFNGDTGKGYEGLFNSTAVTKVSAAQAINDSATDAQILSLVNTLLSGIAESSENTSMANTLLMPLATLNYLATRRLGDTQMTLLQFIRDNNIYTLSTGQTLDIRGVVQLATAGTGGTKRMVAYRKSPQVVKLHLPMPHKFLPPWKASPLRWDIAGIFRMGGTDWRRPHEARYMDGV